MPIAADVVLGEGRSTLADVFLATPDGFPWGHTFSGNPLGCAVAAETIRVIGEEGLLYRARELGDRLRADVRVEAFNLTNTPPLGQPNGTFGSAAFGSITSAGDPRVFELVASKSLAAGVCADQSMRQYLNLGATFVYSYFGNDDQFIAEPIVEFPRHRGAHDDAIPSQMRSDRRSRRWRKS